MPSILAILDRMRENPKNVRFEDLAKICRYYFGAPRHSGGSHEVYKMPWQGDPRVNIQNKAGKAKPYQVRQVLAAVDKYEKEENK